MKIRSVVPVVIAVLSLGAASARAQVAIGTISGSTSYSSEVAGFVAYIDLRGGQFTPVVTPLALECRKRGIGQVSLLPTDDFHTQNNTVLALTANTGPAMSSYVTGTCGLPAGVIVSDGNLVNPGLTDGPVLYFTSNTRATVTSKKIRSPGKILWAVAGTTVTGNDCLDPYQIGTLLVSRRRPGECAIPKSQVVAPRGAAGVDRTGKTLIIAVVVGQEGSTGLLTADLAKLMIGLGAHNAVNFDGGGSTVFYWTPSDSQIPTQSQRLAHMLQSAHFPVKQSNPNKLTFHVTLQDPTMPQVYDAEHRPIYASFGLRYRSHSATSNPE